MCPVRGWGVGGRTVSLTPLCEGVRRSCEGVVKKIRLTP